MADRPNVLFVFPDQLRHDWIGAAGEVPVRTPTVDDLADRGTAFENAVTPSPLCGPARACLASGMEYDRCGVRGHRADYPLASRSLYDRLRDEAGYHVLGTGKFDLQKRSHQVSPDFGSDGVDHLAANGFSDGVNCLGKWDAVTSWEGAPRDPYTAFLAEEGHIEEHVEDFMRRRATDGEATFPTSLPDRAYCDNWIGRRSLDLLQEAPADRPWFLQVNFAGPHAPWDVTEAMHGWYRDPPVEFPDPFEPREELTAEEHQAVRRNYAAMTENIDRWVDRLLGCVEDRGERDDTVVIFASDHGELLGDHGYWSKKRPEHGSVGVPLIVAGPGIDQRGMVDDPATILDLHATVLDWAGLSPGDVDSRSMASMLAGDADAPRGVVHSGFGHWRLAFDGRYKRVRGYDGDPYDDDEWNETTIERALTARPPRLYDLESDPAESTNRAGSETAVEARLDEAIRDVRSTPASN